MILFENSRNFKVTKFTDCNILYVLIEFGAISDAAFVDKATFKERVFSIAAGLIFVVSDLTLAIDKFVNPIQNAKFFILSTYFLDERMNLFSKLGVVLAVIGSMFVVVHAELQNCKCIIMTLQKKF